jgi:hypothetical protein
VDDEPEEGIERLVVAVRGQGNVRLEYNTSVLEEKSTACHMLYQYATRLKGHFMPYVPQVLTVLAPLVKYRYNENVRVAAVLALPALLTWYGVPCLFETRTVHKAKRGGFTRSPFHSSFLAWICCAYAGI